MKKILKEIIIRILKIESKIILYKYKPRVVAITGSVGKTSTKDAVYAVLSKIAYVRKSDKSYNSQIGLPLTILGVPNGWSSPYIWFKNILKGLWLIVWPAKYPAWLVLEVGVGKPGDMDETASWLSTDVVIMTTMGSTPVHIEFFDNKKHIIEEKTKLIKTLKKDGVLVLNRDDEVVFNMKDKTKNRVVTYGFSEEADVVASETKIFYDEESKEGTDDMSMNSKPEGMIFRVDKDGSSFPVVLEGVFGRNHVYASLAALGLSASLSLKTLESINALRNYKVPPGRMCLLLGLKKTFIIDDTYNSSPVSCSSALDTLKSVNGSSAGRKIAVLGDMLELGKYTQKEHKNVGIKAKESADFLMLIGPRSKYIKEGAIEAGMKAKSIKEFKDSREAGQFLKEFIEKGDTVLVKGSQGVRMERTVEAIMKNKQNKDKLLVRQEPEWLAKE